MSSDIDNFLDRLDQRKFQLHAKLKLMTPAQRRAFWNQLQEEARARGLPVAELTKATKPSGKRVRRSG